MQVRVIVLARHVVVFGFVVYEVLIVNVEI